MNAVPVNNTSTPQRQKPTQGQLVEKALESNTANFHPIIDIAVNLADSSFDKDRQEVVKRAKDAKIESVIITGCCLQTTQRALEISESLSTTESSHDGIPLYFTAGVHPHNAKQCDEHTLESLKRFLSHTNCVAVGECGLDFNRNFSPPDVQEHWFSQQILLAEELEMPLFMHCRDAGERFLYLLKQHRKKVPGVVHCFTGSRNELEEALSIGLSIGITGWICDERAERGGAELASLLKLIPDDKLMIETDAPYLTPRSIVPSKARPSRNEPALLQFVLEKVASARGQSIEHVARITTENAVKFFGLRGR